MFFLFQILLQMVAKGKDASDLFPAVVKNVVSKNIEVCYKYISLSCSIIVK